MPFKSDWIAHSPEHRPTLVEKLRPYASRIALFGSAARGTLTPDSDIDVLLTLRPADERPPLGLQWFDLEEELHEILGRPVELVTERARSRHMTSVAIDLMVLYEEDK